MNQTLTRKIYEQQRTYIALKRMARENNILLTKYDGTGIDLKDQYKNETIFFVGSGPSLTDKSLDFLRQPGVLSFSVNNAPVGLSFSPTFWTCFDDPKHFHANIYNDATITKLLPSVFRNGFFVQEKTKNRNLISNISNTYFYIQKIKFEHQIFFDEPLVSFGNQRGVADSLGIKGCRSVMLGALKLICYLGFKRIFLIGCDFHMQPDKEKKIGKGLIYSFPQYKHPGGVITNNLNYEALAKRFTALKPQLEKRNIKIFNCTPNSKLEVFPQLELEEAIQLATEKIDSKPNTKGYYGGRENHNRFGW